MAGEQLGEVPLITSGGSSVGLVEVKHFTFARPPNPLVMENGETIGPITVAYETYGELNAAGDNTVLIEHALTGSAHVAGRYKPDDKYPGWWDVMIGPGKAFDTDKYFIVCSNLLGSCYGTTGPSSPNPATGEPFGMRFPLVCVQDLVRVQKALLDHLGINRLFCVAGGSLGGMQALEWGKLYPGMVDSLILIATATRSAPQSIAIHKVGIQAIMDDPNWNGGDYYGGVLPTSGLSIARMLGHITYLSDELLWEKFGRVHSDPDSMKKDMRSNFEIENYLEYQGKKFVDRFDANTYLYLMRAIDIYDTADGYVSLYHALSHLKCRKVLVSSFSSDWLYPSYQSQEIVDALKANSMPHTYEVIESSHGHDSFLVEHEKLTSLITPFLETLQATPGP